MKIASWNVNSLKVRLHHVLRWLEENQPDVLGLQETKMTDDVFPAEAIRAAGYEVVFAGQKTYNGVAVLAKQAIADAVTDFPDFDDEQRRVMAVTVNGVRVINLYVPNGQALDSDKFVYKRQWFATLQHAMRTTLNEHSNTVLVGDFNITPGDIDVHDPKRWEGKIHCSDTERLMLQKLMSEGLYDTYRQFHDEGNKFSWWDYRGAGYNANEGLRIDLILSSASMLRAAQNSWIDEAPRKLERPSDHTPVVAEYHG